MMDKHPLPWRFEPWMGPTSAGDIRDAAGKLVASLSTRDADAILAVTNKVPALVEAAEQVLNGPACIGHIAVEEINSLRTALAAFKTP
jgi:hypothetical protein